MHKHRIAKVIRWTLIVWFIMLPFFWHFNLSQSQPSYYDAFTMAPLGIFHLVVFFFLAFFDVYLSKVSLLTLLLLGLYFPLIQLANYPYLTYRDVYLHAAPVETILANGKISYTRDPAPESWPASFNLHGTSSIILGLDLIATNYVLYLAMVTVLTLTSYVFAKRMEKNGYRLAGYSALLFQCLFANYLFDFNHYARSTFEFVYLFLFFLSFMFFKGRRGYLLQLVFAIAVLITHPFASFALMIFATSYFVLASTRSRPTRIIFTLLSIVTFTGWFTFAGLQNFQDAIGRLQTFLSPQYVSSVSQTFSIKGTLPLWGVILRELFRYSQAVLLAIACITVLYVIHMRLRHDGEGGILVGLASFVPMSLIIILSLLLLPDWGISRASAFTAFPAAFSSLVILDIIASKKRFSRLAHFALPRKKAFLAFLLCYIVTLSASIMVLRFERNYYFGEATHNTELSSLSFFFSYDRLSNVTIVSWRTTVYSAYFNYEGSHATLRLWYKDLERIKGNSSELLRYESGYINQSQAVIRGMRDEFDFASFDSPARILNTIDQDFVLPKFNQVFSNGYYSVFKRSAITP